MAYTTINKSSDYFNTVLITGDANDPRAVTGYGFAPDLIFAKQRNGNANGGFFDKVRGATKFLYSNQTDAEGTTANTPTSFDSDGFTIGDDNSNFYYNGYNFVYWGWRADGTSGSSNTDGTITSTVSANTTSGFSIVSYTGNSTDSTIGHGLGQKPDFIMVKERDSSSYDWVCYHSALGAGSAIALNLSDAAYGATGWNNSTEPTSTVFSVDSAANSVNKSGSGFIAYCFAEKKGFSKFGSYVGNGNADGTFIYTGFKPAFVMVKRTDTTASWLMYDNKRDSFNVVDLALSANLTNAEDVTGSDESDFLSNGIKMRNTGNALNASGGTYIYMAFAESPLVGTNNIPATAR